MTSENGFIGRPFTNCFLHHYHGYSIVSFIHNVASIVLARVPLSYILSINFPDTLLPMGFAAPAGSLLSVLICLGFFIYFRRHGKL